MTTHDDLDTVWLLTRSLSSDHGPQPASRARTTYQRAVYALQDWRQDHNTHSARALLIAYAALARTNPALLNLDPIDIDAPTLSAAASLLADAASDALFDAQGWRASLATLDELVNPDVGWDDHLVDQACSLWEALLDALDLSCALNPHLPALAFALEGLARPLVIGLGERYDALLPASDLSRADAGTLHPELADEPELLWISSLMLHAVQSWEHWALDRYMARSAADHILAIAADNRHHAARDAARRSINARPPRPRPLHLPDRPVLPTRRQHAAHAASLTQPTQLTWLSEQGWELDLWLPAGDAVDEDASVMLVAYQLPAPGTLYVFGYPISALSADLTDISIPFGQLSRADEDAKDLPEVFFIAADGTISEATKQP